MTQQCLQSRGEITCGYALGHGGPHAFERESADTCGACGHTRSNVSVAGECLFISNGAACGCKSLGNPLAPTEAWSQRSGFWDFPQDFSEWSSEARDAWLRVWHGVNTKDPTIEFTKKYGQGRL